MIHAYSIINKMNSIILLENITEEFDWVDKLLEAKYYMYSLNEDNIDDFINFNLITDNRSESEIEYKSVSSNSMISNPFCNTEVEQIFNSTIHIKNNDDSVSSITSETSIDTLFLEYIDAYDSDDYNFQNHIYWFN